MRKMTEDILIKMALYYIANDISIDDLAKKYRFEKSVVTKYFEGIRRINLPEPFQEMVYSKMAENWAAGKSTSGNVGKTKLNKKQILQAARNYINKEKSLTEMANELGVSRGTLYNNIFNPDIVGKEIYMCLMQQREKSKGK